MGYYNKIYNLGSATDELKKPERPKPKPISEELKMEILKKQKENREEEEEEEEPEIEPKVSTEKEPKSNLILIAVPCYRTILVRTAWSIIDTLREYPETDIAFQNGIFVHENQNKLVEIAQEKKASHIFLIEHDVVFEPDTLGRLLEQDKDVIAAPYSGRKLPLEPLVYQQAQNGELYMMSYDLWPDKPFKAYGVPTGCTLIKMSVFDKISKPYFFFEYNKDGVMKESQDIYFSKKVQEAGMECWCDPMIPVTHIGDFDFFKK